MYTLGYDNLMLTKAMKEEVRITYSLVQSVYTQAIFYMCELAVKCMEYGICQTHTGVLGSKCFDTCHLAHKAWFL